MLQNDHRQQSLNEFEDEDEFEDDWSDVFSGSGTGQSPLHNVLQPAALRFDWINVIID